MSNIAKITREAVRLVTRLHNLALERVEQRAWDKHTRAVEVYNVLDERISELIALRNEAVDAIEAARQHAETVSQAVEAELETPVSYYAGELRDVE